MLFGIIVAVVAVSGVITLALASSNHKTSATANSNNSAAVATNIVNIKNYMFAPAAIKVAPGSTVTWTNQDDVSHTITADTASIDSPSSMDIAKGQSYSFQFKVAGTYSYHCFPHPYMHGSVIVSN